MPTVELRGWPEWTDDEDLVAVVEGAGHRPDEIQVDREEGVALARFSLIHAAGAVAAQLNGFEFTPGYPLLAKAVADPLPQGAPIAPPSKGVGKGAAEKAAMEEGVEHTSDYPVSNCVGAGRIEGWLLHPKSTVESKGWGHLQSFSFEGNVLFKLGYSPLLAGEVEFKHQDPCTFEVVQAADGQYQAVRLALADQEGQVPEAGEGDAPWEDPGQHELESFIGTNRRFLNEVAEAMLRGLSTTDANRVISAGTLQGVRDPVKVMQTRIENAKVAAGEVGAKKRKHKWTDGDWAAWNNGTYVEGSQGQSSPAHGGRDQTWGNEEGTGCFFGSLQTEVDEAVLKTFAESCGQVNFVKLFMDHETGVSRGCGKVFFATPEQAMRAVQELHKKEFMGRLVTCEVLGDENRRKKKRGFDAAPLEGQTEEGPKLLPLSYFSDCENNDQKMELCLAAFEDLLQTHDPVSTGKGVVWMVRGLIKEVNEAFVGDDEILQELVLRFKKHQWFWDNEQQIKWQVSKRRINLSKISPEWKAWKAQEQAEIEQGGVKGKGGKGGFQGKGGFEFRHHRPEEDQNKGFVQAAQHWANSMNGVWANVQSQSNVVSPPTRVAPTRVAPSSIWTPAPKPSFNSTDWW